MISSNEWQGASLVLRILSRGALTRNLIFATTIETDYQRMFIEKDIPEDVCSFQILRPIRARVCINILIIKSEKPVSEKV